MNSLEKDPLKMGANHRLSETSDCTTSPSSLPSSSSSFEVSVRRNACGLGFRDAPQLSLYNAEAGKVRHKCLACLSLDISASALFELLTLGTRSSKKSVECTSHSLVSSSFQLSCSIACGDDSLVRIKKVFPMQPAWQTGRLRVGDVIVSADGIPLAGLPLRRHETASQ